MPYIKHHAHHFNPKNLIEYVLDKNKNPDLKLASGVNCNADVECAYDEFRRVFEKFSNEKFYSYSLKKDDKYKRIRLHHYIQSFDPKDNLSPEVAHKIGMEWARKVWGDKRQILCSTHLDKSHVHNHFIVASYDFSGKMWNDNKKTLNEIRKSSDEVCLKHGVSIIENTADKGKRYNEWREAKSGRSWKDSLRDKIDFLIADSKITTINELMDKLQADGCKIRRGKFISVKPPEAERAVRLYRLGNGYSEEQLKFRLQHKDKETSLASIMSHYEGISVEYALVLRQVELSVYKKRPNPKRWNYKNLMDGAELLSFVSLNQIKSYEQFEKLASEDKQVNTLFERYKKELTDDYTRIFEQVREERREAERIQREMKRNEERKKARQIQRNFRGYSR